MSELILDAATLSYGTTGVWTVTPSELLIKPGFCIPASTFQRLQDTAATNGWRIGHVVEHALELYLRKPTPPATQRRPVGRPRKSAV